MTALPSIQGVSHSDALREAGEAPYAHVPPFIALDIFVPLLTLYIKASPLAAVQGAALREVMLGGILPDAASHPV